MRRAFEIGSRLIVQDLRWQALKKKLTEFRASSDSLANGRNTYAAGEAHAYTAAIVVMDRLEKGRW